MGLFDWVEVPYEILCDECGKEIDGWQSKSGPCQLRRVGMGDVDSFYTTCCNTWYQFDRVEPPQDAPPTPAPLTDFKPNHNRRRG